VTAACSVALKPSAALAALSLIFHGLALAAAWLGLDGPALGLAGSGVVLSAIWTIGDALLVWPSSIHAIELEDNGTGQWQDGAGRRHSVTATRASWVSAGMVVLGLRMSRWRTRWVVMLPDAAAPEPLRKLRIWLRWRPE
jgi:hypothetical protein